MTGEETSFEYSAFISYRHADNAEQGRQWATWLHTALEQFEVPADLVGTEGIRGSPVLASLYPVFRDEDELPASADLNARLHHALERSQVLIVICSPRAVLSQYVEAEIRYFKELGRADAVLALIVEGSPKATSGSGDKFEQECFPATLRMGAVRADGVLDWSLPASPIAADARPEGGCSQGWTSAAAFRLSLLKQGTPRAEADRRSSEYGQRLAAALLKIIAGTLGTGLRELTRRDKARQLEQARIRARRFKRLATSFFLLAILAIAGGAYAWKKKRDEESQRSAAEDLVGFMLHDMRDKLTPLRRTDLLQSVTDGASRYFDRFPGDPATDIAKRQRAALLATVGNIHYDQNRLREADLAYQSALHFRRELLDRYPHDTAMRHDLWQSLQQLGYVALKHRQLDKASAFFQEAADASGDNLSDLASSRTSLAGIAVTRGDSARALELHLAALDLFEQLSAASPQNPESRRSLALIHNDIGGVYLLRGNAQKAAEHFKISHGIRIDLGDKGQGTAQERRDLSVSLNKLGTLHQKRGELAAAEAVFSESLSLRRQLVKEDPLAVQARRDVAASYHKLGDVHYLQCRFHKARESFESALQIRRLLAEAEQSGAVEQRVLCFNLDSLGRALFALGQLEDAERLHIESLQTARRLAESPPGNADSRRNLAVSLHRVAAVQFALRKTREARLLLKESLDLSRALVAADPVNAEGRSYHCEAIETLCAIQISDGDIAGARLAVNEAFAIRQELARTGLAGSRDMAIVMAWAGVLACAEGSLQDAITHFASGLTLVEQQVNSRPEDPPALHALREFTALILANKRKFRFIEAAAKAVELERIAEEAELEAAKAGNPLATK